MFAEQARGRLAASAAAGLDDTIRRRLAVPFGLQAGWRTAAAAVNLAAVAVDRGPARIRRAPTATGVATVLAVGAVAGARIRAFPPDRSTAYAATVLWALAVVGMARNERSAAISRPC